MTIVIKKVGIRRYNVEQYAAGAAPAFVAQMKSREQALKLGEWYTLRLRDVLEEQRQELARAQAQARKLGRRVRQLAQAWGVALQAA